ncbi:MAG: hypothetical protein O8C66_03045 [Candidatus Methanoperedens sp.]|nr:hypothetical protein [Candidatus Methanoperedens sp.]MCZ7369464.1 hypothetical protein [Candidatus Methanoperedens sp.]
MAKYSNLLLIMITGLAIIASGCTGGQDVTSAFKALPEVQQFMNEHPSAKITVTYWSKDDVVKSLQEISQQCDKPITPVAMYKATVSEGDLKVVSWINAENQILVCSTTQGSGGSQIKNPTPNPIQTQIPTPIATPSPTSAKPTLILWVSTNLTDKGTPMVNNVTFEESSVPVYYKRADALAEFPEIDANARTNKLDSVPVSFWASVHRPTEGVYTLTLFFKDGMEPKKGDVLIIPIRLVSNTGAIQYKTTAFYCWSCEE